ncbi:MAG: hypothetical protein HFH75_10145 [Lachnospiraceae bacterium]|jgi:hypothetical protein|nr:hypothetical protein [Lachnospiraceae bacterium]
MQKVCGWQDTDKKQTGQFRIADQRSRRLYKNDSSLTIAATGGCSRMAEGLSEVLKKNYMESPVDDNYFRSIVLVTDRDDSGTEHEVIQNIERVLLRENAVPQDKVKNNQWSVCEMETQAGDRIRIKLLILVIPFEEDGAMETFLLNAIASQDAYDKVINDDCKNFVDHTDKSRRYLRGRRLVTKAKFDAYFCVRTAAEQFHQRRDIIKNIPWEEYAAIQKDFVLLETITDL